MLLLSEGIFDAFRSHITIYTSNNTLQYCLKFKRLCRKNKDNVIKFKDKQILHVLIHSKHAQLAVEEKKAKQTNKQTKTKRKNNLSNFTLKSRFVVPVNLQVPTVKFGKDFHWFSRSDTNILDKIHLSNIFFFFYVSLQCYLKYYPNCRHNTVFMVDSILFR